MKQSLVRLREGVVVRIVERNDRWTRTEVEIEGEGRSEALSYHEVTGPLQGGERVCLNTTAVHLGLGTGGLHFVCAVRGREADLVGPGHIVKARYTPLQVRVHAVEEASSPYHERLQEIPDLDGMPVLVGSLHSQVPIAAAAIKSARPRARIAYVMTDGGALPAAFSRLIDTMRASGLVEAVFTAGHAYGGDYECVSVPSAMAASRQVAEADAAIVAMGPGVVGTGTPLGTTALEVGPYLDAAGALGAGPVAVVRASEADGRARHRGISHHTMTALERFTHRPVDVPLAKAERRDVQAILFEQARALANRGHRIHWYDGQELYPAVAEELRRRGLSVTSMGRGAAEDPLFFWTAAAAGAHAAALLE